MITSIDKATNAVLERSCFGLTPETAEQCVRSVLETIREPNDAQYEALARIDIWRNLNSQIVWQTYIDALLNEKPQ